MSSTPVKRVGKDVKPAEKTLKVARYLAAVAVPLCVWLIYELMNDPYEKKRATVTVLDERGSGNADWKNELPSGLDYEKIQKTINDSERLWGPLVRMKKPPPPEPNLGKMISGLRVVAVLSVGNEVQVMISDPKKKMENVYKKGDKIRGLTIDGFTFSEVILSLGKRKVKLPF